MLIYLDIENRQYLSDIANNIPLTFGSFFGDNVLPFSIQLVKLVQTTTSSSAYIPVNSPNTILELGLGIPSATGSLSLGTGTLYFVPTTVSYSGSFVVNDLYFGSSTFIDCNFNTKITGSNGRINTIYNEQLTLNKSLFPTIDFRLTENNNNRITEIGDFRILNT